MSNVYIRQTGLIDPDKLTQRIGIVGAGGIGSWTTLALLKMGCQNVTVYDFDTIEEHNAGSQIYTASDAGQSKVEALKNKMFLLAEVTPEPVNEKLEGIEKCLEHLTDQDIVIFAVDNIDARKEIYECLKGENKQLIDGRMAGNAIEIYTINLSNPEDQKFYEETLFSSEETLEIPCSERAVVYNCFVMAGLITDIVAHIANEESVPKEMIVDLKNFTLFK